MGHIKLREFLRQRLPERVGEIVDSSGRVIGQHRGAWYYTIGQRHGLGIGGGIPYYVARKDVIRNQLTVAAKELVPELVEGRNVIVKAVHWIDPHEEKEREFRCQAKIRYQQPDQRVTLTTADKTQTDTDSPLLSVVKKSVLVRVVFDKSQFAIAPGQAIVFYDNDRVLGGGIIK